MLDYGKGCYGFIIIRLLGANSCIRTIKVPNFLNRFLSFLFVTVLNCVSLQPCTQQCPFLLLRIPPMTEEDLNSQVECHRYNKQTAQVSISMVQPFFILFYNPLVP